MLSFRIPLMAAALGVLTPACELFESDFTGSVSLTFLISDPDPDYSDIKLFDPETNKDFADNKDRVETGTIEWIELEVLGLGPTNAAKRVRGEANLRIPSSGEIVPGVAAWGSMLLIEGNSISSEIPDDKGQTFTDLIFEADSVNPLEIQVDGRADQGPVEFDLRATLHMRFTANAL